LTVTKVFEHANSTLLKPDAVEVLQTFFIVRVTLDIVEDVAIVWLRK
jgi:hypothetical protein